MMASTGTRFNVRQILLSMAFLAVAVGFAACGGSDNGDSAEGTADNGDNGGSSGGGVVIVTSGPGEGSGGGVVGAVNVPTAIPTAPGAPTSTPTPLVVATPTPTPPSKTISEEGTARLVDELSSDEYPRTSARVIEREFRNEPDTAKAKIGKDFVIQGDVLEAGKDPAGQPYVHFKAGAGRVTCFFEVISEPELLRFSPDGTNAVVGTIDAWDAENRILTVKDCRVVLGF